MASEVLKDKKVLVTGGFGYIGKHVVLAFLEAGAFVEVWDKRDPFKKTGVLDFPHKVDGLLNWNPYSDRLSYTKIDIVENEQLVYYRRDNDHFDIVVHLAAVSNVPDCETDPDKARLVNITGTGNMLRCAARWDARFLNADSAMSPFSNKSIYAETKAEARQLTNSARWLGVVDSYNLTLYNVAGAHPNGLIGEDHECETHFIPNLVNAAITHKMFELDSNARVKRDFVHVCDVASAFVHAASAEELPNASSFDVGTGIESNLIDVFLDAGKIIGTIIDVKGVKTNRWEPYDNAPKSFKFAASPERYLPDWSPKFTVKDAITDQYNFMENRLPK